MNSVKDIGELRKNIEALISVYNESVGTVWYKLTLNTVK